MLHCDALKVVSLAVRLSCRRYKHSTGKAGDYEKCVQARVHRFPLSCADRALVVCFQVPAQLPADFFRCRWRRLRLVPLLQPGLQLLFARFHDALRLSEVVAGADLRLTGWHSSSACTATPRIPPIRSLSGRYHDPSYLAIRCASACAFTTRKRAIITPYKCSPSENPYCPPQRFDMVLHASRSFLW
jgi:hypothetical protein